MLKIFSVNPNSEENFFIKLMTVLYLICMRWENMHKTSN